MASISSTRCFDGSFRIPCECASQTDILGNGHVREEGIGLKDHAHIALVGSFIGDIDVIDDDGSGGGDFKASDHAQGGRFSATGWAQEGDKLALFHLQVKICQPPWSRPNCLEILVSVRCVICCHSRMI